MNPFCLKYILVFCLGMIIHDMAAQRPSGEELTVSSKIYDLFTSEPIKGADVSVYMLPDTVLVRKSKMVSFFNGEAEPSDNMRALITDRTHKYILKVEKDGYLPEWITVDPSDAGKHQVMLSVPPVYLEKKGKQLKEVTVTASKVKFYHKGDTLVYNADAFVLPQGSMLDALLEQLPGVRMDENGEITVNGRRIDYLLLDGKEFFDNNRKLMLKNIASYTIKNVNVYESRAERFNAAEPGQEKLMMDVKLKKEYQKGYIANAEAGYGSSGRWLGRLFGMIYTTKLRLSLIGNANNLNDERRPAQNGSWSPSDIRAGEKRTTMGALDYYYDAKDRNFTVNGTLEVNHADFNNLTTENITTFLPSGNRFGYRFFNEKNKGTAIRTNHTFFMEKPTWSLGIYTCFNHNNTKNSGDTKSAEFNRDLQEIGRHTVDNLYDTPLSGVNPADIINRVLSSKFTGGHSSDGYLNARYKYKFLRYATTVTIFSGLKFSSFHNNKEEAYMLNIGADRNPSDQFVRNFHDHPNHTLNIETYAEFNKKFGIFYWTERYGYTGHRERATSQVFMLRDATRQADYASASMRENMPGMTPDYANSFNSLRHSHMHEIHTQLDFQSGNLLGQVMIPVRLYDRDLSYFRDLTDHRVNRSDIAINPTIRINYFNMVSHDKIGFSYKLTKSPCDLLNLVDIQDTTDPLNIYLGNPDLKNTLLHDISSKGNFATGKVSHSYNAAYRYWHNSIVRGFHYDPSTGVKTFTPMNINGNNEWDFSYNTSFYFGKSDRFLFNNTVGYLRRTNNDYVSEEEQTNMIKSMVRTSRFTEKFNLSYTFSGSKVTLFGEGTPTHYSGSLDSFRPFNACDINYGVSGTFKLPHNFGLTTDFTVFMRRGYNDAALNTSNYVWNARLSYSMPKAGLLFMVDGWDMLHDISNVTHVVNSQGRTETFSTMLPRYVMFHVQWRFTKQPKTR